MKKILLITIISIAIGNFIYAQSITSVTVNNGPAFCQGGTIDVTTVVSGSFNSGNVFSAELSNPSGSFLSGTTTLVITSGDAGSSFIANVPIVSNVSAQYRIKVKSTNPILESTSLVNLTIYPSVSLSIANSNLCSSGNNSNPVLLTKSPSNGSFAGSSGAIGNNFYPTLAPIGNNVIKYYIPNSICNDTATINVTVNQTPVTPLLSGNNVLCPSINDTLFVTNYNSLYVYSSFNGSTNLNNSNDTIIVTVGGAYSVVANNNGCSSTSQTLNVTQSSAPASFSINAPTTICKSNNPILLSGIPAGGSFGNNNVIGGYFTPLTVGSNLISYSIQNQFGCIFNTTQTITVTPSDSILFTQIAPLCLSGSPVNLSTLFSVNGVGSSNITYIGNGIQNGFFNPALAGIGSQTITCNSVNSFGCNATAIGNITVLSNDNINFNAPTSICNGSDSIILVATPLGGVFSGNGVVNGVFFPSIAGLGNHQITYTTLNSSTTCSSSSTVSINVYNLSINAGTDLTINCGTPTNLNATTNYQGNNVVLYSWSPSNGLSNSSIANPICSANNTTNYIVTANVNGCSDSDSINVTINQANFNVNFSNQSTFIAPPFNVAFSNNTPNPALYSFVWDFGDGSTLNSNSLTVVHQYFANDSFNVSLTATNLQTGCVSSYSVQNSVITSNACTHTATINETSPINGCAGDNILLTCNTIPGAQYQWNLNGFPISGAPNSSYNATQGGTYTVTLFLNGCPQSSAPVQVILAPSPATPNITILGNIVFCGGGTTTLSANAGFTSYQWRINGNNIVTNGNSQNLVVSQTGYYSVVATANGCTSISAQQAVNNSFLAPPNMCAVSIDTIVNKPVVEWTKPNNMSGIKGYYLMRESSIADVYDTLKVNGNVLIPDTAFSSVIDFGVSVPNSVIVNTNNRSYKYKLAIQDTCLSTTLPSSYHKTILLQTSIGVGNQVNLLWNNYEGLPITSYQIKRRSENYPQFDTTIATVAASSGQINLYTDYIPNILGTYYYRIDLVPTNNYQCAPTVKSNDPDRAQRRLSQSNIGTNKTIANGLAEILSKNEFKVSPNPSDGHFNVSYKTFSKENIIIEVTNILGTSLHYETWNLGGIDGNKMLHLNNLSNGVYFVNFKQGNKTNTIKVVIAN